MAVVGDLAVRVGADIIDFKTGMAKASAVAKKFSAKTTKNLKKVAVQATKMAAAATAASGAVLVFADRMGIAAKELGVFANVANTTEEEFQKIALAAKGFNIENEKLADILKDVNDRVGDFLATGGGPMADFFEKIAPRVGVTANEFRRLSGPESLQLYINSLEKANLSQEEMTFYLEAMASDLTNLLPLFSKNGSLLKEQAERAERLGLILSNVDTARLQEMNKELNLAKKVVSSVAMKIGAELAPFIEEIAERFLEATENSRGWGDEVENAVTVAIRVAGKFADVMHGLKVVFKGVELVAVAFGAAAYTVFETTAQGFTTFTDVGIQQINKLIESVNKLPGVDMALVDTLTDSDFMKGLRGLGDESRKTVSRLREELHNLAMQELPSENVEEFLQAVRDKSIAVAEEMAAAKEKAISPDAEEMSDEDKYKMQEDALRDHLARMYGIQEQSSHGISALIEKQWGLAQSSTVGAMASIAETMGKGNKKAFEISKKFAIADALISTFQGIAAGVKLGWPMAIPAVAWAAATGFAQISKIKSQNYNGGGGGGSAAAGSTASAPAAAPAAQAAPQQQQTLVVAPIDPNAIFSGGAVQAVAENIYDFTKDGGKVVFGQ